MTIEQLKQELIKRHDAHQKNYLNTLNRYNDYKSENYNTFGHGLREGLSTGRLNEIKEILDIVEQETSVELFIKLKN